jgi:glycosyltransferase involved in cell wall biosynthesis
MRFTVAIDTSPLQGDRSGVGRFVEGLLRSLNALDPTVDAPTLMPYVLSRHATDLAVGTIRLPWPAEVAVRLWEQLDHPSCRRSLGAADVVHGTNYIAPPTGGPTVVTVHDCSPLTHPLWCAPVVRRFAGVLRRAAARGVWIHVPSQHVATEARALLDTDRVVVIPHGPPEVVEPARTTPATRHEHLDGAPYIVAIGTLEQRKNLPRLVDAFGLVSEEQPDLHLVLVGGDGNDRSGVETALAALASAARGRVHLTGRVDESARLTWLRGARALAYPSLDEGFGLPLLEAMALDIPIVASTSGAIAETVDGAALLVDPLDVTALADGLVQAVHDSDTRIKLIADGRRRLGDFSWERTANEMTALYHRAARSR